MKTPTTRTDKTRTQVEARLRMEKALAHIQRAQEEMGRAQAEVSSLIGMLPQWNYLGKTYDRIKAAWYKLHDKRFADYDLDGSSAAAFLANNPLPDPDPGSTP